MKELISELIPSTLGRLESRLKERGGQFFAGNKLTWADLHVFAFFDKLRLDNAEVGLRNISEVWSTQKYFNNIKM